VWINGQIAEPRGLCHDSADSSPASGRVRSVFDHDRILDYVKWPAGTGLAILSALLVLAGTADGFGIWFEGVAWAASRVSGGGVEADDGGEGEAGVRGENET